MKPTPPTKEELNRLYDPDFFYEHGDNIAFKKFMLMAQENIREGKMIDYRTPVLEKYTKVIYARNWDDILQRDLKCVTFPRSFAIFLGTTIATLVAWKWTKLLLPLGENGITKLSQTQFYHLYGPLGTSVALTLPLSATYLWYKTAKFTARKFYNHVLMGKRAWLLENHKNNPGAGEYYFKDTPLSHEEALTDVMRGEMAKKKWPVPEVLQKK